MILNKSEEQWREIKGFNGKYLVSNKGRVKNINTNRILGGGYDGAGYKAVILNGKNYNVHRLVALAFLDNPHKLPQVNHKNEKKNDNNVGNLEWCSKSYNVNYSNHKRSCKVKQLTKDGKLIKIWDSISQINRELGYDISTIVKVLKGKRRSAYSFKWEYLDSSSQKVFNRPVIAFKGSERIGEFPSAKKAAKALGLVYRSVHFCLQGRFNSNKGYSFSYAD